MPKLNVGKRAPDLTLRASTGDAVSLRAVAPAQ